MKSSLKGIAMTAGAGIIFGAFPIFTTLFVRFGGDVDSFMDHRIAMTAAVGMIATENGGNIHRNECCAISFPDFFEKLDKKI